MKVRSSTRATSVGSEAQWNELGLMSWFRRVKVPDATSLSVSVVHSRSEPVTQEMRSGVVSAATSATQEASPLWLVEPSLWICSGAVVVMRFAYPSRAARYRPHLIVSMLTSPSGICMVSICHVTRAAYVTEWTNVPAPKPPPESRTLMRPWRSIEPGHRLKSPGEVPRLEGEELVQLALALLGRAAEDHRLDDRQPRLLH